MTTTWKWQCVINSNMGYIETRTTKLFTEQLNLINSNMGYIETQGRTS